MIAAKVFLDRGLQPWSCQVELDRTTRQPPPQTERCQCYNNEAGCRAPEQPLHETHACQMQRPSAQVAPGTSQAGPVPIGGNPAPTQARPSPGPSTDKGDYSTAVARMPYSDSVGAVSVFMLATCHELGSRPCLAMHAFCGHPDE